MTLISIPANIVTGGVIQATDETTVYNVINGNLDATNITPGSLTGAVFSATSISFTKLKATSATVGVQQAAASHFGGAYISMPSATSFWPGISTDNGANTVASLGGNCTTPSTDTDFTVANVGGIERVKAQVTTLDIVWLAVINHDNVALYQAYMTAEYLQTSPPYDLGDGEIPLFVFALVDDGGQPRVTYVGQDPPWAAHSKPVLNTVVTKEDAVADPTKMKAYTESLDRAAEMNKGLKILKERLIREPDVDRRKAIADTVAQIEAQIWRQPPQTQEHKNRRMGKVPHPFIHNDLENNPIYGHLTPVMLDPMHPNIHRLALLHEAGENVNQMLHDGHIKIGSDHIAERAAPDGVMVVSHDLAAKGKG